MTQHTPILGIIKRIAMKGSDPLNSTYVVIGSLFCNNRVLKTFHAFFVQTHKLSHRRDCVYLCDCLNALTFRLFDGFPLNLILWISIKQRANIISVHTAPGQQIFYIKLELNTLICQKKDKPITVAARSTAWNVFTRSSTGIVGSNPTRDMGFCVCSVFVLSSVGSGFATGLILRPRNPTDCL
jgi:hypothetical protein